MKKLILIFLLSVVYLLLFLFTFAGQSQKIYSVENLEQASQEDLNTYLDKALKLKKDGKTVTTVGAVTLGADVLFGTIMILGDYGGMGEAAVFMFTGFAALGTLAVGIPMRITGKKRVERINTIKNTAYDGIKIDLKPCAQYNLVTQNYQPRVTLKIRF